MTEKNVQKPELIGISALILGFLFDYLFNGKLIGLSVPIFALLVVGAFFILSKQLNKRIGKQTTVLILCFLFFAAMFAFRDSELLSFFNVVAAISLIFLIIQSANNNIQKFFVFDYLKTFVLTPLQILANGFIYIRNTLGDHLLFKGNKASIVKGLLIALPFVLVFITLFSSADLVFGKFINDVFSFNIDPKIPGHIFLIGFCAFIAAGSFATIFSAKTGGDQFKPHFQLGSVELITMLGVINLLFAAFVILQVNYLFGGSENVIAAGFTYAEYARRGFFELIFAAVITFGIVFATKKFAKEDVHQNILKWLMFVLSVFAMIIVVSGLKRLSLYVDAYGMTHIRFYSTALMWFLESVFLVLMYTILTKKRENVLTTSTLVLMVAFLGVINLINPDSYIARANISRLTTAEKIDAEYLTVLSSDASAEVVKLMVDNQDTDLGKLIARKLYPELGRLTENNSWQSWNYSRKKALELINANVDYLQKYKDYQPVSQQP